MITEKTMIFKMNVITICNNLFNLEIGQVASFIQVIRNSLLLVIISWTCLINHFLPFFSENVARKKRYEIYFLRL